MFREDYKTLRENAVKYIEERIAHLRTDQTSRIAKALYKAEVYQLR